MLVYVPDVSQALASMQAVQCAQVVLTRCVKTATFTIIYVFNVCQHMGSMEWVNVLAVLIPTACTAIISMFVLCVTLTMVWIRTLLVILVKFLAVCTVKQIIWHVLDVRPIMVGM